MKSPLLWLLNHNLRFMPIGQREYLAAPWSFLQGSGARMEGAIRLPQVVS